MINFFDLAPAVRTGVTALCFLAFCMSACLGFIAYRGRFRIPKILLPIGSVISGIAVVLYSTILRVARQDKPTSKIADLFGEWPVIIVILLIVAILIYSIFVLYKEVQHRKNTLTRTAIKEGIDKVSSGLCFYDESGRIILKNNSMDSLCYEIVGRDLQNAALFWEILSGGETLQSVDRLTEGENPSFRLSDDSVWTFIREDLGGVIQLFACEITSLQAVTDELKEKNVELAALVNRLREYGENADELTRSKERLEIKVHIHRELGQTLLASRRYLLDEEDVYESPIEQWQKNIAILRKEAELPTDETPIAMLIRAAKTMGVKLAITGELPESEDLQKMFVQAAAEALTNAIGHAGAKTLYIHFLHDIYDYIAQFTNDGEQPKEEVIEGGGLSSLRRKIEREGGSMIVDSFPEFTLTVTLPMKGGKLV